MNKHLTILLMVITISLNAQISTIITNPYPDRIITEQLPQNKDFEDKIVKNFLKKLSSDYLLLTETFQMWMNDTWDSRLRDNYFYDENNNLIQLRSETRDSIWKDNYNYLLTYDANNNMVELLTQINRYGIWYDIYKTSYTFNENDQLLEEVKSHLNYTTNEWDYIYKNEYTYGSNNKISEIIYYTTYGTWYPTAKDIYTYNANNDVVDLINLDWVNTEYVNYYKTEIQYDSLNKAIDSSGYHWDNNQWLNHWKKEIIYDSTGNVSIRIEKFWENNQWNNGYKFTNIYDSNGKLIQYIWQLGPNWDNISNCTFEYNSLGKQTLYEIDYWSDTTWYKSTLYLTQYNQFGDKVSFEKLLWDNNNWEHSERYIYTYNDLSSINLPANSELTFRLFNNYPNPFNPNTKIKYQLPKECKVQIKIYDLLGAEVQELLNENKEAGIYEVEFNAENLTSGIYIYRISAGNYFNTKKMILIK
jgi:hypothetical protein